MSDSDIRPSVEELKELSGRAIVAYTCRCIQRVFPLYRLRSEDSHNSQQCQELDRALKSGFERVASEDITLENLMLAAVSDYAANYAAAAASYAAAAAAAEVYRTMCEASAKTAAELAASTAKKVDPNLLSMLRLSDDPDAVNAANAADHAMYASHDANMASEAVATYASQAANAFIDLLASDAYAAHDAASPHTSRPAAAESAASKCVASALYSADAANAAAFASSAARRDYQRLRYGGLPSPKKWNLADLGPLWPEGKPDWYDKAMARIPEDSSQSKLVFEVDIPDGMNDEEIQAYVAGLALSADLYHRELGGHGLKIDRIELTCEAGVPVGGA